MPTFPIVNRLKESLRYRADSLGRLFKPYRDHVTRRAELADLEIANRQLQDMMELHPGYPPPPRHLQERVIGGYVPGFVRSGDPVVAELDGLLKSQGASLSGDVLDFGCGCGRVLLALSLVEGLRLSGSDIDEEAIKWCQDNFSGIAEFAANPNNPPTRYPDSSFDFLFSVSVFTHLPETMQFEWLEELRRITRPGGYLALSFHGSNYYFNIPEEERSAFLKRGFYYLDSGGTEGLPEFYQTAFHTHDYIRREWSKYFDVLVVREKGIGGAQDVALCRKRH
ncbi:MAG: methyltransferase domain-containing protein [Pyrinomonadaceae bacterium]